MTTATKTRRRKAPLLIPPPETIGEGLTLAERNGLRHVSGLQRAALFPPSVETLDALVSKGMIEPHPERFGDHRPTERGVDVLPKIGVSG